VQVEYRGYGDSDAATIDEAGLKLDSVAALNYLLSHGQVDSHRLFIFGRSLGGAVAFHLAEYCDSSAIKLAGVIVENTFTSIGGMVDVLMPFVRPVKGLVLRIGWFSDKIVPKLNVPILYLSGGIDELVPPSHMRSLYENSVKSIKKVFHVIPNGTHNDTWVKGGVLYWQVFDKFVRDCLVLTGGQRLGGGERVAVGVPVVDASGEKTIPIMKNMFFNGDKTKEL